ncbi:MAG: tetratricopeptide repeat protein [Flavobacteriaceae bacterium]|nr:tetratricopeptide repeat protein [Flavobacteriaceae bacterium]
MKKNVIAVLALCAFGLGYAQKKELKTAEKALKNGDVPAAEAAIAAAEPLLDQAPKYKSLFHYLKGNLLLDKARKGQGGDAIFDAAIKEYNNVLTVEENGKAKYGAKAKDSLIAVGVVMLNSAIADNKEKKYKPASEKLYKYYELNPKDTIYLYYAASTCVQGKDYEGALVYYNKLKDVGYDGSATRYMATNVETGKKEDLGNKGQRDLMVKSNAYKDPVEEKVPSKRGEIVKNIALIYNELGQSDKAKEAFAEARKDNPGDAGIIISEAMLYLELKEIDKFKSLTNEAIALEPNNHLLHFNYGTVAMENGEYEEARKGLSKAVELKPDYIVGFINYSSSYINEGNSLVDQINELVDSNKRSDMAKYDELKAKKESLFAEGAKVLEEGLKANPGNTDLLEQLKNIYGALGDTANYKRIKDLLGQ